MEDNIKPEENLIIGKESDTEEELDWDVSFPTDYELVIAACNALDTVESMDPLYDATKKRKRRIIRKSMEILDYAINNLHSMCFDEKKEDDDNQEN